MHWVMDATEGEGSLSVGIVLAGRKDGVIVALQESALQETISEVVAVGENSHYNTTSIVDIVGEKVSHEGSIKESRRVVAVDEDTAVLLQLFQSGDSLLCKDSINMRETCRP